MKHIEGIFMKNKKSVLPISILIASIFILIFSLIALVLSYDLAQIIDVIGIRIAALVIAFASFGSSSFFSYIIYTHNRTVSQINDDLNRRAELFRELQFASSNYTIIEFMDRMLIYDESSRYVERFLQRRKLDFHMIDSKITLKDVLENVSDYQFISIRIPFRVIEGKVVANIELDKLSFDRENTRFEFVSVDSSPATQAFILYNELTKRNNLIMNLIVKKSDRFFVSNQINVFSKIKVSLGITSLLSVKVKGINELYFTNPEQIEGDGTNTYKIVSSNFTLTDFPKIEHNRLSS